MDWLLTIKILKDSWLLIVDYSILIRDNFLLTVDYWLLIIDMTIDHRWSLLDAWCMMRDAWCVMLGAWCLMLDATWVMSDPWCSMLDAWRLALGAWCVMLDAWCLIRDAWCLILGQKPPHNHEPWPKNHEPSWTSWLAGWLADWLASWLAGCWLAAGWLAGQRNSCRSWPAKTLGPRINNNSRATNIRKNAATLILFKQTDTPKFVSPWRSPIDH